MIDGWIHRGKRINDRQQLDVDVDFKLHVVYKMVLLFCLQITPPSFIVHILVEVKLLKEKTGPESPLYLQLHVAGVNQLWLKLIQGKDGA